MRPARKAHNQSAAAGMTNHIDGATGYVVGGNQIRQIVFELTNVIDVTAADGVWAMPAQIGHQNFKALIL
jgi:hypothetical protein